MFRMPNIDVIVDLQFGSTGKGLLAGYLSNKMGYDTCISVNGPNAGHTFCINEDLKFVNKVLPSGIHSPYCERALIGPGAVFDVDQLIREANQARAAGFCARIIVHENAWVLQEEHKVAENGMPELIGSTGSGMGGASVAKIARGNGWDDSRARWYRARLEASGIYVIPHRDWISLMQVGRNVLLEGSQGYSLSINGGFFPYCTSRDCTVSRLVADAMVPFEGIRSVYGSMRVHPIRVGGNSGGWYIDQNEISWEDIGVEPEMTTVTGRERRIATFSFHQVREAVFINGVTHGFLNFANYDRKMAEKIRDWYDFTVPGYGITHIGYGPLMTDVDEVIDSTECETVEQF